MRVGAAPQPVITAAPRFAAASTLRPASTSGVYTPDSLTLSAPVAPRTFLFHGTDAPRLTDHGMGGTEALAEHMRQNGFPEAKALRYNSTSTFVNLFAIFREQIFGTFSKRMTAEILADLAKTPLAPGQKVNVVGYSLGAQVAKRVAENLAEKGVPVGTVAFIEPLNGSLGRALYTLPAAEKVVVVENQEGVGFRNPHNTPVIYHHVPQRDHFAMLEDPDPGMVRFLLDQLK